MTGPTPPAAPVRVDRPGIGTLLLRAFDPTRDVTTVHDWVNRPYARFWGLNGKSRDEVAAIYRKHIEERGVVVTMACRAEGGEPLFLMESYDPGRDELGRYCALQPGDRGFHLLMGPADHPQPGMGYQLLAAACTGLFSDPAVRRLVGEPDIRNRKVLTRLLQLGFRPHRVIHLPYKTALLVSLSRHQLQAALAAPVPARPVLSCWSLRVRWHLEVGRVVRLWRRVAQRGAQRL